jgi:nicotinate-nucleotide pyrophosphorylase (carboxylating)
MAATPATRIIALDEAALRLIDIALAEDVGPGDWTTRWTVPARLRAEAEVVAKANGVVAGLQVAAAVFARLNPRVEVDFSATDGQAVAPGDPVCVIRGPARAILTGERTALNVLQRLSGVATVTSHFVKAVQGTSARILDTRKTTPGLRMLEKAAVRAGGGENHRTGLYDMVLIKDNHIAVAGGITQAVRTVRDSNARGLSICVEARDLAELNDALAAGVDRILLDNMSIDQLRAAVAHVRSRDPELPQPQLEASGNITLANVRAVAETGVDFISVGALTHSAPALDLSLRVRMK